MTDAQRQTGIEGNMKALDEIAEVATKDRQLSKLDKARVKQAVAEMRDSLGSIQYYVSQKSLNVQLLTQTTQRRCCVHI